MDLVINEDNLQYNEVDEFSSKVRAILIDENNHILVANYNNVYMLPGGKVDKKETIFEGIIRELNEEIGQDYIEDELESFAKLNYFQKSYPKMDGSVKNRLVQTHFFIGPYKQVNKEKQKLSSSEGKANFKLELLSLDNIENIVSNNISDNPRNIYFQKELLFVIDKYKTITK